MKDNAKRKHSFEASAARIEAQIIPLFPAALQSVPATFESNEQIRLRQYAVQVEMLRIARESAPADRLADMFLQQNQAPRYNAADERTVAAQASIQENGGSIFSSAYSRFHFC